MARGRRLPRARFERPDTRGRADDRVEADARISETAPRLGAEIEVDVLVVDEHGSHP